MEQLEWHSYELECHLKTTHFFFFFFFHLKSWILRKDPFLFNLVATEFQNLLYHLSHHTQEKNI